LSQVHQQGFTKGGKKKQLVAIGKGTGEVRQCLWVTCKPSQEIGRNKNPKDQTTTRRRNSTLKSSTKSKRTWFLDPPESKPPGEVENKTTGGNVPQKKRANSRLVTKQPPTPRCPR